MTAPAEVQTTEGRPVYTPFPEGTGRRFMEEMRRLSNNPSEQVGLAFQIEATPPDVASGGVDIAAPRRVDLLTDPPLDSSRAKAKLAIERIESDSDLPKAIKQKKILSLQPGWAMEMASLPAELEKKITTFLSENAPPPMKTTADDVNLLQSIGHHISYFKPDAVLRLLEQTARSDAGTLDIVRASLERITEHPPKFWDPVARKAAMEKAMELLLTLPKGKAEIGAERWDRAKALAEVTRSRWRYLATQFVATGR